MLVLLLKHIFIKCLKHIIKAFTCISTYPILAVIAKHVLSVSASSAPVEHLFSVDHKIFRPDRCQMKDTAFECFLLNATKIINYYNLQMMN